MKHCYIFDFSVPAIYHTILPPNITDISKYLHEVYNFKDSQISFMVSDNELTIEEL